MTVADIAARLKQVVDEGYTEVFVDLHYVAEDVAHALELAEELYSTL